MLKDHIQSWIEPSFSENTCDFDDEYICFYWHCKKCLNSGQLRSSRNNFLEWIILCTGYCLHIVYSEDQTKLSKKEERDLYYQFNRLDKVN